MEVYMISYDLNKVGQDYKGLYKALQDLGPYMHFLDSTWLVSTSLSAEQIFNVLNPHIDTNDNLIVVKAQRSWFARLPQEGIDWMNEYLTI